MEFLALLLVSGLIVRGYSETIQCYECDNCGKLDDSLLQSCPPDLVTSSTSSTTTTDEPSTSTSPTTTDFTTSETTTSELTRVEEINPQMQPDLSRTSRQVDYKSVMKRRSARDSASYHCYSIEIGEGDSRKTKKGCVTVPENKTACEVLAGLYDVANIDCKICSENKCNSSGVLKYSLLVLVITIVLDLLY